MASLRSHFEELYSVLHQMTLDFRFSSTFCFLFAIFLDYLVVYCLRCLQCFCIYNIERDCKLLGQPDYQTCHISNLSVCVKLNLLTPIFQRENSLCSEMCAQWQALRTKVQTRFVHLEVQWGRSISQVMMMQREQLRYPAETLGALQSTGATLTFQHLLAPSSSLCMVCHSLECMGIK